MGLVQGCTPLSLVTMGHYIEIVDQIKKVHHYEYDASSWLTMCESYVEFVHMACQ